MLVGAQAHEVEFVAKQHHLIEHTVKAVHNSQDKPKASIAASLQSVPGPATHSPPILGLSFDAKVVGLMFVSNIDVCILGFRLKHILEDGRQKIDDLDEQIL
jgi:hypothetical protein